MKQIMEELTKLKKHEKQLKMQLKSIEKELKEITKIKKECILMILEDK